MATILPFSGAFMGNGKEAHSNNQKPSHRNNAVLAAAANALTGGVDVAPNFAGKRPSNLFKINYGGVFRNTETANVCRICLPSLSSID